MNEVLADAAAERREELEWCCKLGPVGQEHDEVTSSCLTVSHLVDNKEGSSEEPSKQDQILQCLFQQVACIDRPDRGDRIVDGHGVAVFFVWDLIESTDSMPPLNAGLADVVLLKIPAE